ncbi:uncharacterized protein LOC106070102 isoform X1 [Biomphalaria glabrata]|uniref:Uncharacterized protein LOC106070102 isoform X1 n=1 Tax=Biomphalaria glabrata TaxID=6526 RepID=A0A9W2ZR14_BIOGL|nr:uncharacterized protein LOC106070102 isoform X1 [Biomphalaria glabrata]XP_055877434.1 uncharacterized protein LOC106070102 isoform X1 [Biomphalaria glabrata]XP_055877435.1 uncharacterized protein LOC106070102 isoform X1 [Biomphalaria glabrata]XP_055877436.1 uncharacterized protein LOC106070102 isoform X1 [Biomphalaria glabrata]
MNLAQVLPYADMSDHPAQNFDPELIFVAALFAFVTLLLVTLSCLCCSGGSNSSGSYRYYSRDEDTITIADLLTKPPLADPESVFSELSYDGRTSGTQSSWMNEENSSTFEYVPSIKHGRQLAVATEHSRRSLSVKLNNAEEPALTPPTSKKWSSERRQVQQATRMLREKEKEVRFNSQSNVRAEKSHLSTVSEKESSTAEKAVNENLPLSTTNCVASKVNEETIAPDVQVEVALPGVKKKVVKSSEIIEDSGLKIHKEVAKPNTYAFSSSSRCSFSHEIGHIANGSKLPRTSLPRTEEHESPKTTNRKLSATGQSSSASNLLSQKSPINVDKVDNPVHKCGQHLVDAHMTKANSDHVISYRNNENVDDSKSLGVDSSNKVDNPVKVADTTNVCVTSPETQNGACAHVVSVSGVATLENNVEHASTDAGDSKGVVMRRSFSQLSYDEHKPSRSDAAPKCFSLNLKINFLFGGDATDGTFSAECVPVIYNKDQSLSADSQLEKMKVHTNGHNLLLTNAAGSKDENIKEKMLENSFAAKTNNCKYLESRKRLSEPDYLTNRCQLQISRRNSLATTKPKEKGGQRSELLVHDCPKISNIQKLNIRQEAEEQGAGRKELESLPQMSCVAEVDHEQTDSQKGSAEHVDAGASAGDDVVDLGVSDKGDLEHKEATEKDEDANESAKAAAKLRRSKVLLGASPPRLKRLPVKSIRNSSFENPLDPRVSLIPLPIEKSNSAQPTTSSSGDRCETSGKVSTSSDDTVSQINKEESSRRTLRRDGEQNEVLEKRRKAMVFNNFEKKPTLNPNDKVKAETPTSEAKPFKPVALPRKSLPQTKESKLQGKQKVENEKEQSAESLPAVVDKTFRSKSEGKSSSKIPILIVDDDDDDDYVIVDYTLDSKASSEKKEAAQTKVIPEHSSAQETEKNTGSDESDYDNPWDDLDDAVKRASMRYNRRPSRIALGDKALFLKSAEDLGRLLEEAEKNRKLRKEASSVEMTSPEDETAEAPIIPFTRFSPYRHTVKGIVSPHIVAAQSTEDIISKDTSSSSAMSEEIFGDLRNKGKRNTDPRRPQSMTTKLKPELSLPVRKLHKY